MQLHEFRDFYHDPCQYSFTKDQDFCRYSFTKDPFPTWYYTDDLQDIAHYTDKNMHRSKPGELISQFTCHVPVSAMGVYYSCLTSDIHRPSTHIRWLLPFFKSKNQMMLVIILLTLRRKGTINSEFL